LYTTSKSSVLFPELIDLLSKYPEICFSKNEKNLSNVIQSFKESIDEIDPIFYGLYIRDKEVMDILFNFYSELEDILH
jgi:hypothetical protein